MAQVAHANVPVDARRLQFPESGLSQLVESTQRDGLNQPSCLYVYLIFRDGLEESGAPNRRDQEGVTVRQSVLTKGRSLATLAE